MFGYHTAVQANMRGSRRLILVEGVADALRCHEAGFPEAVAALTNGLSDEQVLSFNGWRLSEVVVVRDNDDAGLKLVKEVEQKAPFGRVKVVAPPAAFKDVGEMWTEAAREFLTAALAA
jgi:DNA primase